MVAWELTPPTRADIAALLARDETEPLEREPDPVEPDYYTGPDAVRLWVVSPTRPAGYWYGGAECTMHPRWAERYRARLLEWEGWTAELRQGGQLVRGGQAIRLACQGCLCRGIRS